MPKSQFFASPIFKLHYFNEYFEKIVSKKICSQTGLTNNEFMILIGFYMHDCSQKNLAEKLTLSEAAISKIVQILVNKELIIRQVDPKNRRKYNFELTKSGVSKLEISQKIIVDSWEELFVKTNPKNHSAFIETLGQLTENIEKISNHN